MKGKYIIFFLSFTCTCLIAVRKTFSHLEENYSYIFLLIVSFSLILVT